MFSSASRNILYGLSLGDKLGKNREQANILKEHVCSIFEFCVFYKR